MNFETIEELTYDAPAEIKKRLEDHKALCERPDYHPEPNCFMHIKIVTERLMPLRNADLVMTGLFHDLGKLDTVRKNPKTGYPMTPGHEYVAADLVRRYSSWIEEKGADPARVEELCAQHMRIKQFRAMKETKQAQMRSLETFPLLEVFTRADNMIEEFNFEDYVEVVREQG